MLRQIILCLMLVAAALAGWIAFVPSAREQLERAGLLDLLGVEIAQARIDTAGSFDARGPVRVIAEEVVEVAFDDRISAIGDGRARRSVEVRADAAGLITSFEVVAGERVEAGSVLARLDNQAEEIALERARIMVADSADNVERLSRLQSTGAVSGVQMRDAELALRSAELEVRQAEVDLAKREIRAPIAGWVGIIDVEEGDRVGTQDALLTITDRSEIYVDFRVPERIVGRIAVGMPFAAMPLAMPDMRLDGTISAIDTTIDRASRTLRLQGRLDNTEDRLRAGMAISIELSLKGDMYPAIDPLAVQWSSEGSYVWVVRDGKVERVPVLIRQRNADSVLVAAEFAPGDQVVTEGVQTLRPGTEVIVVGPVQAALPAPETGTEQQ